MLHVVFASLSFNQFAVRGRVRYYLLTRSSSVQEGVREAASVRDRFELDLGPNEKTTS